MKYTFILLVAMFLFSCKEKKAKPEDKFPDAPTKILPDVELEDPKHDSLNRVMRRGRKPKPVPPPDQPPPPTAGKGVIYLDFDGHLVSGTLWNLRGDINALPSGLTVEQQKTVYDSVTSYYKQFPNIVVTTSEAVFNSGEEGRRIRIVITITHEWYGTGAGGVAYINSFTWYTNEPAFVFSGLYQFNVRTISDASAHEAGHTLGLRHQVICTNGVVTTSYNPGPVGSRKAPIMGWSAYDPEPSWWIGPSSAGCATQNDSLIIKTK